MSFRIYIDPGLSWFLDFIGEQYDELKAWARQKLPKFLVGATAPKDDADDDEKKRDMEGLVTEGAETYDIFGGSGAIQNSKTVPAVACKVSLIFGSGRLF